MRERSDEMRERALAMLAERGMLASSDEQGNEPRTIFGQPAWRAIEPGHEPQALMEGTARQRDLVASAFATPAAGPDQCATWVERVFARLGLGQVSGSASELYRDWCRSADTAELLTGMIVAVPSHPWGNGGRSWGHVGLYVGDGRIMHCDDGRVRTAPLEAWLSVYGVAAEPRWGWLGGIALG